jgi:hypothetical protein
MSQLSALVWLKWRLFRNAMRSRKARVTQAASFLVSIAALGFALVTALGLGFLAWMAATTFPPHQSITVSFLILSFVYVLWVLLPVSLGSGREFDPGRLVLYPISLSKLFVFDFLSDLTSIAALFGIPTALAFSLGAGIGHGKVLMALPVGLLVVASGLSLSKFVTTSLSALLRKRKTRGETLIALIGVVIGLGGAFLGQLVPYFISNSEVSFAGLQWTPSGAAALALMRGLSPENSADYFRGLLTLSLYSGLFLVLTYQIARRSALQSSGSARARKTKQKSRTGSNGWQLPFVSEEMSAIIEKETRYALRNAQLRMLAVMPLLLIAFRLLPTGDDHSRFWAPDPNYSQIASYGEGLLSAGGVLYVFLLLASVACNVFAFEEGGMRAFILSPIDRKKILIGKNLVTAFVATGFALILLVVNQLVFGDLTIRAIVFALLSIPAYAVTLLLVGNWLSIRFPKRMKFGKRMNVGGLTGLLLLPLVGLMALPPFLAAAAGYASQSLSVKYATLGLFAVASMLVYRWVITGQGRALAEREHEILEAVTTNDS